MVAKKKTLTQIGPEEAWYEYARSLKRHTQGRRAVIVRLSVLGKYHRQPHHLRTASKAFDILQKKFEGQIFVLSNSDIVVCLKGARVSAIDDVIIKVRYMFQGDEELKALEARSDQDEFCHWFDLEDEYKAFLATAKSRAQPQKSDDTEGQPADMTETSGKAGAEVPEPFADAESDDLGADDSGAEATSLFQSSDTFGVSSGGEVKPGPRPGVTYREITRPGRRDLETRDMTIDDLQKLVRSIATTDMEPFIKRYDILLIAGGMAPKPVLAERNVPLSGIREALLPSCREDAEPYLKRYLQQAVDQRTLKCIQSIDEGGSLATSLRTTIPAIESQDFKDFEVRCAARGGHRVVLEFSIIDILLDVVGYLNVRAELRSRGYRVMIGDMDPFAFISLDRLELPCDFEKVRWVPEFQDYRHARPQELFREAVEKVGSHRVILSGCDDSVAFEFGQEAGINLYSGSYTDSMAGAA